MWEGWTFGGVLQVLKWGLGTPPRCDGWEGATISDSSGCSNELAGTKSRRLALHVRSGKDHSAFPHTLTWRKGVIRDVLIANERLA
jgi:hypothetical protein